METKTQFISNIDLRNYNDSMEMDSKQEVARLISGDYVITLEVCGEVRVLYNGEIYRHASQMPKELIEIFHNQTTIDHKEVEIGNNNWFEIFIYFNDDKLVWAGLSETCEPEGMSPAEIESMLKETLDEWETILKEKREKFIKDKLALQEAESTSKEQFNVAKEKLSKYLPPFNETDMIAMFLEGAEYEKSKRLKVAVEINWETDGADDHLPRDMRIPYEIPEEKIANYLSDKTGFQVLSYRIYE